MKIRWQVVVFDAAVMALGAKVLKPAPESSGNDNFQVYADPAGHPFCLCWIQASSA